MWFTKVAGGREAARCVGIADRANSFPPTHRANSFPPTHRVRATRSGRPGEPVAVGLSSPSRRARDHPTATLDLTVDPTQVGHPGF